MKGWLFSLSQVFFDSSVHKSWYLFAKSLNWECVKCVCVISDCFHFESSNRLMADLN